MGRGGWRCPATTWPRTLASRILGRPRETARQLHQTLYVSGIDLLAVNPAFPYRLTDKPYVNYWFPDRQWRPDDRFQRAPEKREPRHLAEQGGVPRLRAPRFGELHEGGRGGPAFEARSRTWCRGTGGSCRRPRSSTTSRPAGLDRRDRLTERFRLESNFLWARSLRCSVSLGAGLGGHSVVAPPASALSPLCRGGMIWLRPKATAPGGTSFVITALAPIKVQRRS